MALAKTHKNNNLFPTLLSDFFYKERYFENGWLEKEFKKTLTAVNIKENDKEFNIEFAASGFRKNDFNIRLEDDILTINAKRQEEKQEEKEKFRRKEFSLNLFSRSFIVPKIASADKIDAKYTNGILKLNIPKKEKIKSVPKKEIKFA